MIHYKVALTHEERKELSDVLKKGKHSPQQYRNACILLNCDEEGNKLSNEQIALVLPMTTKTVERLKQRFAEEGYEACMEKN